MPISDDLKHDAGEFVPYARKHAATAQGSQIVGSATLAELWPEPDWKALVRAGMSAELAAYKLIGYHSLRAKPRPGGTFNVSAEAWEEAYRQSIWLLRLLYEQAETIDQCRNIADSLLILMGINRAQLKAGPVSEYLVYWAAGGGGTRTIHPPVPTTARLCSLRTWLARMGWPESDAAWRTAITPLALTNGTWVVAQADGNGWRILAERFTSEQAVLTAAIEMANTAVFKQQAETKLVPRRPQADKQTERIGPDYRNGSDVSADALMAEFNLRAIQYGNSVTIRDRQRWLNQTFDALADLADVLGMKRRWLGLSHGGNALALAIGARGQGSANAHYETSLKVINLTYRNGAGTLSHEIGHALDDRLGITIGTPGRYATSVTFRKHYFGYASTANPRVSSCLNAIAELCLPESSRFYAQASAIAACHRAGGYWMKYEELFARSFEAFVQDTLIAMGRSSPWLVHGTLSSDYDAATSAACPYPEGDEREQFAVAYKTLLMTLVAPA